MKSTLIIGSGGYIGLAIVEQLRKEKRWMSLLYGTSSSGKFGLLALDVTDPDSVRDLQEWLKTNQIRLDAIIYAAGDCGEGAFYKELTTEKQDADPEELERKSRIFGLGLLNIATLLIPEMNDGGQLVMISSAPAEAEPPDYLSGGLYGAAISAQELMIKWMREDTPTIKRKGIRIHRIAPGAVEGSPYYNGTPPELMPKRMVPIEKVAEAVTRALLSEEGNIDSNCTEA